MQSAVAGSSRRSDWPAFGGTLASTRYSPLTQIHARNVHMLEVAWTWESPDDALAGTTKEMPGTFKATPIMIDGVLYTSTSFAQVAAIDAGTGVTRWLFDPRDYQRGRRPANSGWVNRGVAYWEGRVDGRRERRIFIATGLGELIALNADTGEPISQFGRDGRVDLQERLVRDESERTLVGFNAPPMIVNDVIILGNVVADRPKTPSMPAGHIQAFDVRSGAFKWIFHTVPREGEVGVETWEDGSWRYSGNTNAWGLLSADPDLGLVYVPTGTPTNDGYGGDRLGNNLYAESLLAIEVATGKLRWHFQGVHHGLWDYDFCAAPILADLNVNGRKIKAVAQVSKQGFTYVFDRATGVPVWPIEERPVPQSSVPGERTSPTQPFPTRPPPFAKQGISRDDLIDFTPELRAEAEKIVEDYVLGPLFTPPIVSGANGKKGVLQLPGAAGGANWPGAALDPTTNYLYVPASNVVTLAAVAPTSGSAGQSRFLIQNVVPPSGPRGLPLIKPPYGTIVAIDLNRGEIAWQVPHGDGPRDHPALKELNLPPLGAPSVSFNSSGGALVTGSLLFANQAQATPNLGSLSKTERFLRAFDKVSGELLWEHRMKDAPYGNPMTYMHRGKQYLVVAVGGRGEPAKLIAYALPK
jgi:quinoprotein glucose dehydrogenase